MTESLSFVTWFRARRKQLGYTQQDLAARVNCSWETIRSIEHGSRKPSQQLAELLVEALEVPPHKRQALVSAARDHSIGEQPERSSPDHNNRGNPRKPGSPNNLPQQLTSFVGREKEVASIRALLRQEDAALVTLTGAGGSGKSRLALQVAAEVLDAFPGGVYFVVLAPITDPALVATAIARTLGVQTRPDETIVGSLKNHLRDKQMLLLLDNFEQVIEAAPLVADLLTAAPRLTVLVTSREALRVREEHNFHVLPLSLPDTAHLPHVECLAGYESVRLFVDRARAHKPDFQLTEENAQAVAEICNRLDGLPLAIELAAARIRVLSPRFMLTLLQDRLGLLTGGPRDVPARQQTLRSTIGWSYDLLNEAEKKLFRRLAAFQGGRTLEAIEQVCNEGDCGNEGDERSDPEIELLDLVGSLVSKSLLQLYHGSGGELRFWLMETIYEYARERLKESGEAEEFYRRHALYFMRLAEEAEPHLTDKQQLEWLNKLEYEHNNIRAALRWATERSTAEGIEIGLRIVAAIWQFWYTRGYFSEGREHTGRLLKSAGDLRRITGVAGVDEAWSKQCMAKVLNGAGRLAHAQGDTVSARALHEESLAIRRELGDKHGVAISLSNLANIAHSQGDYISARALHEESLAIFRELGDKQGIANALNQLGLAAYTDASPKPALGPQESSLTLRKENGCGPGADAAAFPANLGFSVKKQWNYVSARALHEESLAIFRELGDKQGIANALSYLGYAAMLQGNYDSARALHEESLALYRELGDRRGVGYELCNLAALATLQGDYASARTLNEEALAIRRDVGDMRGIASALSNLANAIFLQGDYASAHALHEESLTLKIRLGARFGIAISLGGLGEAEIGCASQAEEGVERGVERGVHLLAVCAAVLEASGVALEPDDQLPYERAIVSARALLSDEAFGRAWQEGGAMSMEQAIEYALGIPHVVCP